MVREMLTAEERAKCWKSRDLYFNCMEENEKSDNKEKICTTFYNEFSANCPPVWVKHFTRRQKWVKYKEEVLSKTKEPTPK